MTQTSISLALAGITFLLTVIWGMPLIRILRRWGMAERRPGAPGSGETLTMGGLLFVLPVLLVTVLLNFADTGGLTGVGLSILLPAATLVAYTLLGGLMDYLRLRGLARNWQDPRYVFGQLLLAAVIAYGLRDMLDVPHMYLPFYRGEFELGFWFLPAALLVVAGTANAFQVTGGVEGLPGMLGATTFATYGAIAILQEQVFLARFCFTVVGALLGFLWFNIKPASLHMGRTGTLALGAALAVVAFMTGQWPLLVLVAIVPLVEIGSLVVHRILVHLGPGRSPFRAVPLHNHLMAGGWSSTQIVQRFWLINLLFAMIGVTLAMV